MTVPADAVETIVAACVDRLGDPSGWITSEAYQRSLALCIIESIQSSTGHHEVAVVDRYLAYRSAHTDTPLLDGARDLLRTFEEAGSSDQWAGKVGCYKRRYTDTGMPIAARHIQLAAERLHQLHIDSIDDLLVAARDQTALAHIHSAWTQVGGERSEAAWAHLLMLAGLPGTMSNRVTEVFIGDVLGADGPADDGRITELLEVTAAELGADPAQLEYAIRRWISANTHLLEQVA